MVELLLRNIIGFLVQVVPCALLCLMPFEGRFRTSAPRAWGMAAGIIAVGLIPFLFVATMPLLMGDNALGDFRNPLQNLVFIITVGALFVLYRRVVDAPAEQKAFVFAIVVFFAFCATLTSSNVSYILGFAEQSDGFMYYPPRLAVMAGVYVVLFCAMVPLMRTVRRALGERISKTTWLSMAGLLAVMVATLLLGAWLPPFDYDDMYFTTCFTITVDAVILVWWMLRLVRRESAEAERRAELEHALRSHMAARKSAADELARARERVAELERAVAAAEATADTDADLAIPTEVPTEQPIVLSTASQAVSFLADEVTYIDSLNRVRTIHFAGDELMQIDMTLAAIFDALPESRFAYCHRSVVVNLRHVRTISPAELVLDDGTTLPVSRRRYSELRDAMAGAR